MGTGIHGAVTAALLAVALWQPANAEVVRRRVVSTMDDFIFLGKFCFDHTPAGTVSGTLDLVLETPTPGMKLLFFDDEPNSWPKVYGSSMSCEAKTAVAKNPPGPVDVVTDGWKYHLTVMESLRPRFWYVVVARCGAEMDGAIEFSYQLSFYNKGTSHLSCEDEGILATCSLFLVVWAAATALQFYGVNSSRQQGERLHPVIALLTSTMTLETVSLALFSLHWLVYTGNGIGLVDAKTFAQFFSVLSLLAFTGLLMLLAKGWTISSEVLENRLEVVIPMAMLAACYLLLEVWGSVMRDQATTLFVFDTPAGWLIVLLHIAMFAWFWWRVTQTYEEEGDPDKQQFYERFRALFGVWFLAVPLTVIAAAFLQSWQRVRFTMQCLLLAKTLGTFGLAYLMWPTRASAYFKVAVNSAYAYESL